MQLFSAILFASALGATECVPIASLNPAAHDRRQVAVEGFAVDIVNDEVDDRYSVILLEDGDGSIPVFIPREAATNHWIYAKIRVIGQYLQRNDGKRQYSGPIIEAFDRQIETLSPAPTDRTDAPPIDLEHYLPPAEIMHLGRRSVVGQVLSVWSGCELMLRSGGKTINLRLAEGQSVPRTGEVIKAAGFPAIDLYRINLQKVYWKYIASDLGPLPEEPVWTIDRIFPAAIVSNGLSLARSRIDSDCHGRLARIRGEVRNVILGDNPSARHFILDVGGRRVDVDTYGIEGLRDITTDCSLEITGYCRLDTALWQPHEVFPQIRAVSIVPRKAGDIVILTRPPWWTPRRLVAVIGILIAGLAAFVAWNRYLSRSVEQRSRLLYRAELKSDINRTLAVLKVRERTNLAVELHDSISQYLTAVALEIDSAVRKSAAGGDFLSHLKRASQTLRSCRNELRNCLWDLRNDTLNSPNMRDTLRQAIQPQIGEAKLEIDFNIRRAILSDNIAYAAIRIARELAVNAVRHGAATTISINGVIAHGSLAFTVTDNGTGFDPTQAVGPREGHYGLQGIRERVRALGGEFVIESAHGRGTCAQTILPLTSTLPETENL